jgi:hypothetical protein
MTTSSDKIIEYCLGVALEFEARVNRMRVFVRHNLSSGNANEIILREFLSSHTSGNYHVGQGFICTLAEMGRASKQCDILIYNQNDYPLIHSDGPIKIVWPESARMVIEVKTKFDKNEIETALENIKSAKELNRQVVGIIFAFNSPKISTIAKNLQKYQYPLDNDLLPDAILLFDKGVIIHRWGIARYHDIESGANPNAHAVRVGKGSNKSAVVVTFLLLIFLDIVSNMDYVTNAKNMLIDLIKKYTDKEIDDIFIGKYEPETAA